MASSPGGAGGSSQPPNRQEVPPNPQLTPCMWCTNPLPHPGAPICNVCGQPQKKCIKCAEPIPSSYQICLYCHAPQQHETKLCLNPECKNPLLPGAAFCAICQAPQNPAMFQQFHKVNQCLSCSTKLLLPGQQMCHACGAPQHTSTSMEHSSQVTAHSPHWHPPPHTIHPPLNFPQSPSEPPPNLPQPQPLFPDVSQSTEQQHLPHGQQSNKRSPEGDNYIANKKSRTDEESGAVSQVPCTSPTTADSAHEHGIAVQPVLPDNPVTSPTTQTTSPHPITKNTASSSPPGSSRPSDPPPQGSPQSAYHTDTPSRPCSDSTSLGTKDFSVQDSHCQSTISQPCQLVASDHVDPQSPIFPTHHDETVSIQKSDHPQENSNLPQQPLAMKVNQEKERKRIRSLSPTPQSGDDDSESLCLKKHRAESESHSEPEEPQSKPAEEPSSEQGKQKISSSVNSELSSAHALPSETDNLISLLDLIMEDKEQLSPACAFPVEAYDSVPSPDLSNDNEQCSPAARALPSKRSLSISSDDSVPSPNPSNSDNEEYQTPHESHPNVDEVDSSTLSSKEVTEKSGLSQKEPAAVASSRHGPLNACSSDGNQKDSKKDKKVFVCYAVTNFCLFCCRRGKETNHRMATLLKMLKRMM